jgi:hypothetical protein
VIEHLNEGSHVCGPKDNGIHQHAFQFDDFAPLRWIDGGDE